MGIKIIGHRGNGQTSNPPHNVNIAPENTLLSFREAFERGADGIETDVFCTKDHEPVLFLQPEIMGRKLSSLTLAELKAIKLPQNQTVPTLSEFLDLLTDINKQRKVADFIANIELKGYGIAQEVASKLTPYINDGRIASGQIIFSSFNWGCLKRMNAHAPSSLLQPTIGTDAIFPADKVQMPYYYVAEDQPYSGRGVAKLTSYFNKVGAHAIDMPTFDIRPEIIDLARTHNVGFCTYPSGPKYHAQIPELRRAICLLDEFTNNTNLPVYFKVDDIALAKTFIDDCINDRPTDTETIERVIGTRFVR